MTAMTISCHDRDRIFENGTPDEWTALKLHAQSCAVCAEEIRAWEMLSTAAQELRDGRNDPELWHRIQRALTEEADRKAQRARRWRWLTDWKVMPIGWQTVAAGALIVCLSISATWVYVENAKRVDKHFLKNSALAEVERTEAAYVQAIDKLAVEVKPQIDNPATPLLASYREKLLVLDSAIADLRAQAGENPSNAHLRYQLLAIYQEKQRTLEEISEIRP